MIKYGPYSPSRMDTGACGYAFKKLYIDEDRAKYKSEGLAQARGSAVHEVFEKITARMVEDREAVFKEADIRQWVTEAVHRHPAAYQELKEVIDMAKLYIRRPPALLTEGTEVELKIAVKYENGEFVECHYDDPNAFGRGRADVLVFSDDAKTALFYDHKTQPNVEEADTFQFGFYAWMISKIYPGLEQIHTVLHFARYGAYSEPHVWDKRALADIEDEILTRISIIESKVNWEATPNDKCQYCPFLAECPAFAEFIERDEKGGYRVKDNNFKVLTDTNQAVKIAGLLNLIEQVSRVAKAGLKKYVESSGSVAIPGKIYGFVAKESVNWEAVNSSLRLQAYEIFEKHKVDPKMFMGFSQTFSQSVWMTENVELIKELSDLFPRKTETEFRGSKA